MFVSPMLATLAEAPLQDPNLVYEPKYDGIRAIVEIAPATARTRVSIWSRNGNEKTGQFPAIVRALETAGRSLKDTVVIDGEIVALDEAGRPAGFQRLQGRIHVTGPREVERLDRAQPVSYIAFDLLRVGDDDLCARPLSERRERLEKIVAPAFGIRGESRARASGTKAARAAKSTLRISEQAAGDGRKLHERALAEHWEGLIAKDVRSTYQAGRRSPAWRKIKVLQEQEFVIGGWTEPRQTRQYFGALLLGVYEDGRLTYVGHTGTGFDQKELARVSALLKAREVAQSPFSERLKTNEPAHWVRPELVAQVKFTEWTADRRLRHPVYLGLRDDKNARDVIREAPAARARGWKEAPRSGAPEREASGGGAPRAVNKAAPAARARGRKEAPRKDASPEGSHKVPAELQHVIEQLRALEQAKRDGTIELPGGSRLGVTNLSKVFWPQSKLTKGDLLRYYVGASPMILPAVADRPLVMKRFPNGVDAPAFYQQRSRQEKPPQGVRIERLPPGLDPISEDDARRFVGGSLLTLLYMTQIAAISQDPWFSRVQSPLEADYVALDLDPGDETPFARVLDVARWIRDELKSLGVPGVPKTSGSSGLHVYVPLPPGTSYQSGLLLCQIVATVIASRHPKAATVERSVRARPRGTVYVDYLQNILGKTLATAYSARASAFAGVSTPLSWKELDEKIDPREYTIVTAPARFEQVGDLWARLRTETPADFEAVFRKYSGRSN